MLKRVIKSYPIFDWGGFGNITEFNRKKWIILMKTGSTSYSQYPNNILSRNRVYSPILKISK